MTSLVSGGGGWDEPLASRAAEAVAAATGAVRALQVAGAGLDLETLAAPLLRSEALGSSFIEALGSSFIEGLRASNKRLALAAYEPLAADGTARAVLGNLRAMERAVEIGTAPRRFRLDHLLDIHRTLLEGTAEERDAGVVRTDQNWIGGRGLNRLQQTGVLVPTRVGRRRDREWISDELFQLLDAFEYDLGQPADGGSAQPVPAPTRPPRRSRRPPGRRGR